MVEEIFDSESTTSEARTASRSEKDSRKIKLLT